MTDIDITQNITISIPPNIIIEKFCHIVRSALRKESSNKEAILTLIPEDVGAFFASEFLHSVDEVALGGEFFSRDIKIVADQLTDTQQFELVNEILYKPDSLTNELDSLLKDAHHKHNGICINDTDNLSDVISFVMDTFTLKDVLLELADYT